MSVKKIMLDMLMLEPIMRPMTRTEKAARYRAAARRIELGLGWPYCCHALGYVGGEIVEFERWFKKDALASGSCKGAWMSNVSDDPQECRDCRVLALCFMAAIVERP